VLATANRPPGEYGHCLTHWTMGALSRAVVAVGLVAAISSETIRRWLKAAALKPHQVRSWMNSHDPRFREKIAQIVALYLHPPQDSVVVSVDERTQMQAIERFEPDRPMQPGRPARRESSYRRHGTCVLFAALVVHTGQVLGQVRERRSSREFCEFLLWLIPQLPSGQTVHLILDNLSIHTTPAVRALEEMLQGRLVLHFTPTHASWVNQVELFFSVLHRRLLARGDFKNVADLAAQVLQFIADYNRHHAHPYRWTYEGVPLAP